MTVSKAAAALRQTLQTHKASEIREGASGIQVVEVDSKMTNMEAASVLWTKNILGAPVWDADSQQYIGFFDMRDILSAVTVAAKKYQQQGNDAGEESKKSFQSIIEESLTTGGDGDTSILPLAKKNPFVCVTPDTTLEDLCSILTKTKGHRVPIVESSAGSNNKKAKCIDIVSQSALVKFLSNHVDQTQLADTLDEAKLPFRKEVLKINDEKDASEAFELMVKHSFSGIAVVDEDGLLVGNTSARDIKLASTDEGKTAMDKDILSYLATVRQATFCKNERYPSCHVHDDSTVAHVLNLLAKTGYHRVFVVDKDLKPVGVVSVTDIIKFAIENGGQK